jgi:uncharacterized membrane protein
MSTNDLTDDFFSIMASIEQDEKALKKSVRAAKKGRSPVRIMRNLSWGGLLATGFLAIFFGVPRIK